MMPLKLRPSKVAAALVVGLSALCVIALVSSDFDQRFGLVVLFLIYGLARREWRYVRQVHPRAVIKIVQHTGTHWELHQRSGEQIHWISQSSTVVTRYVILLQGVDAQQRRHHVLLFPDSVTPEVWRRLVGALRLRTTLVAMGQPAVSELSCE